MGSASGLIKLIGDIRNEKVIWHNSGGASASVSAVVEQAWNRVGEKNKMSGPHAKSIYGVLCKKYEQEKTKGNSKWQLYQHLTFQDIDFGSTKDSKESSPNRSEDEFEEDGEFIELLEVNEEEEQIDSRESIAEIDNPKQKIIQQIKNSVIKKKDGKDEKSDILENKTQKKFDEYIGQKAQLTKVNSPQIIKMLNAQKKQQNVDVVKPELKKLPGITIVRQPHPNKDSQSSSSSTTVVRQLTKVITKPKQINISAAKSIILKQQQQQTQENKLQEKEHQKSQEQSTLNGDHKSEEKKIPPFENFLKRKIVPVTAAAVIENGKQLHREEELLAPPSAKRIALSNKEIQSTEIAPDSKSESLSEVKIEMESEQSEQNFNKTNNKNSQSIGSVRDQDDFYCGEENYDENEYGDVTSDESFLYDPYENKRKNDKKDVLPKFFRDLYKSTKYDSFGMYVSSTLNRLPKNLAKQLELKILQSIIDVNAENKD